MGLRSSLPEVEYFHEPRIMSIISTPSVTKEDQEIFYRLKSEVLNSYSLEEKAKFRENISRYEIPDNYDMAQLLWDLKRACMQSRPHAEKQASTVGIPLIPSILQPSLDVRIDAPINNLEVVVPPMDLKIRCPQPHER